MGKSWPLWQERQARSHGGNALRLFGGSIIMPSSQWTSSARTSSITAVGPSGARRFNVPTTARSITEPLS